MPITVSPGAHTEGGDANDLFYWFGGGATLDGGEDVFDANPYQPYDLADGMLTGDMLRLFGGDTLVRFTAWNDGFVHVGGSRLDFAGIERVYGSEGNDRFRAGAATSDDGVQGVSVFAGAGDDDLVGSAFNDVVDMGAGADTVWSGAGDDFVNSSLGDDLIYGGTGNENIRWGLGDAYWHDPGNDTIYGAEGRDLINAWAWEGGDGVGRRGVDTAITLVREDGAFQGVSTVGTGDGGTATLHFYGFEQGWNHMGNDTVDGGGAFVKGGAGFHWNTRWGDDALIGSVGNDTLEGGEGADVITGGEGDDLISANGDFFSWSAPADTEVDTLVFRAGHGHDTILAFGENDVLDLGGREYAASATEDGTLLTSDDGDSILIVGVFEWA